MSTIGEKKTDNIGCFVPSYTRTQLSEEDDYFLFSIYIKNAKRHTAIINYFYQIILYSRLFNRVNCMLLRETFKKESAKAWIMTIIDVWKL